MLGQRSRPVTIGKLAGALRSSIMDSSTSPRTPLDCKMHYPRSPKYYDQQGGIGLGIVVALNTKSNKNYGGEILAKYALCGQFSYWSNPIPMINSSLNNNNEGNCYERVDDMLEDEFTYVTCHGPNKSLTTKVYHDGYECGRVMASGINQNLGVFNISSPAMLFDDHFSRSDSDFLNSCQLCRKTLHGKDIYMYRGEKAYCSEECRQKQIGIDERKDKCRSTNVSTSPFSCTNNQIF